MSENIIRLLRSSRPADRGIGALADLAADRIEELEKEVAEWKDRYEAERYAHEATLNEHFFEKQK